MPCLSILRTRCAGSDAVSATGRSDRRSHGAQRCRKGSRPVDLPRTSESSRGSRSGSLHFPFPPRMASATRDAAEAGQKTPLPEGSSSSTRPGRSELPAGGRRSRGAAGELEVFVASRPSSDRSRVAVERCALFDRPRTRGRLVSRIGGEIHLQDVTDGHAVQEDGLPGTSPARSNRLGTELRGEEVGALPP